MNFRFAKLNSGPICACGIPGSPPWGGAPGIGNREGAASEVLGELLVDLRELVGEVRELLDVVAEQGDDREDRELRV